MDFATILTFAEKMLSTSQKSAMRMTNVPALSLDITSFFEFLFFENRFPYDNHHLIGFSSLIDFQSARLSPLNKSKYSLHLFFVA
ncbi:hypothetical protein STRCR_1624 [Streptococcus criceti HS-6]|uniref:Uncharacterized protein n=1 Tax=Streptococcus criceti HS-6 TaxID=873449 RepID=G5JPH2_STRCG|nr:hypothetical protein STRCR_1624 [Streptococcus criceti HS-6]